MAVFSSVPTESTFDSRQRIRLLDALRGFALLGILLGNIGAFSGLYFISAEQLDAAAGDGHWNATIEFWSQVLIKGKFYSLFSLLFGIGVALQWQRSTAEDFRRCHQARMSVLLLLGLLHSLFLWAGDILLLYAMIGLTLPWFIGARPSRLLAGAVALLVSPALLYTLLLAYGAHHPLASASPAQDETNREMITMLQNAAYHEIFALNSKYMVLRWVDILITFRVPRVLGMFLLGAWLVRSRLLFQLLEPGQRTGLLLLALACCSTSPTSTTTVSTPTCPSRRPAFSRRCCRSSQFQR